MTHHHPETVLILTPVLSQARALAFWLKRSDAKTHITGGNFFGGPRAHQKYPFDAIIDIRSPMGFDEFDLVIPTGSSCTSWLIQNRGAFRLGELSFSAENLRVYDKPWLFNLARNLDIPVPETWLDFERIPGDGRPIFYKPKREGFKGPRRVARNRNAVPRYARGKDFLYQEYIPGRKVYGFGFISVGGEVVAECQYMEIASVPFDGGSAVAVKAVNEMRVSTLSRRLLTVLQYDGWGLVEFKYCHRRKDFVLMELNAKWWASLEFALRREAAFGRMLFGAESSGEALPGLFWPARLLSALGGNINVGLRAASSLPWSWDRKLPRPKSILAGILPSLWVDSYREDHRRRL